MNNVKSVMNYFDGNFLFNLYLKNIIGNTNDESYMYEDNLLNILKSWLILNSFISSSNLLIT